MKPHNMQLQSLPEQLKFSDEDDKLISDSLDNLSDRIRKNGPPRNYLVYAIPETLKELGFTMSPKNLNTNKDKDNANPVNLASFKEKMSGFEFTANVSKNFTLNMNFFVVDTEGIEEIMVSTTLQAFDSVSKIKNERNFNKHYIGTIEDAFKIVDYIKEIVSIIRNESRISSSITKGTPVEKFVALSITVFSKIQNINPFDSTLEESLSLEDEDDDKEDIESLQSTIKKTLSPEKFIEDSIIDMLKKEGYPLQKNYKTFFRLSKDGMKCSYATKEFDDQDRILITLHQNITIHLQINFPTVSNPNAETKFIISPYLAAIYLDRQLSYLSIHKFNYSGTSIEDVLECTNHLRKLLIATDVNMLPFIEKAEKQLTTNQPLAQKLQAENIYDQLRKTINNYSTNIETSDLIPESTNESFSFDDENELDDSASSIEKLSSTIENKISLNDYVKYGVYNVLETNGLILEYDIDVFTEHADNEPTYINNHVYFDYEHTCTNVIYFLNPDVYLQVKVHHETSHDNSLTYSFVLYPFIKSMNFNINKSIDSCWERGSDLKTAKEVLHKFNLLIKTILDTKESFTYIPDETGSTLKPKIISYVGLLNTTIKNKIDEEKTSLSESLSFDDEDEPEESSNSIDNLKSNVENNLNPFDYVQYIVPDILKSKGFEIETDLNTYKRNCNQIPKYLDNHIGVASSYNLIEVIFYINPGVICYCTFRFTEASSPQREHDFLFLPSICTPKVSSSILGAYYGTALGISQAKTALESFSSLIDNILNIRKEFANVDSSKSSIWQEYRINELSIKLNKKFKEKLKSSTTFTNESLSFDDEDEPDSEESVIPDLQDAVMKSADIGTIIRGTLAQLASDYGYQDSGFKNLAVSDDNAKLFSINEYDWSFGTGFYYMFNKYLLLNILYSTRVNNISIALCFLRGPVREDSSKQEKRPLAIYKNLPIFETPEYKLAPNNATNYVFYIPKDKKKFLEVFPIFVEQAKFYLDDGIQATYKAYEDSIKGIYSVTQITNDDTAAKTIVDSLSTMARQNFEIILPSLSPSATPSS